MTSAKLAFKVGIGDRDRAWLARQLLGISDGICGTLRDNDVAELEAVDLDCDHSRPQRHRDFVDAGCWGWPEENVAASLGKLRQPVGGHFVIATGEVATLGAFAPAAFALADPEASEHTDRDTALRHPHELDCSNGNAASVSTHPGRVAQSKMPDVIAAPVDCAIACHNLEADLGSR